MLDSPRTRHAQDMTFAEKLAGIFHPLAYVLWPLFIFYGAALAIGFALAAAALIALGFFMGASAR